MNANVIVGWKKHKKENANERKQSEPGMIVNQHILFLPGR
jgi:hypothetical protein